ncbi:hypothetical protein C8Q76DRAFT_787379 [Earliella scabrosa]|nr:hypothetical protein C8Q76DRAFT_787379 [Earliella scabrosa]
MSHHAPYFGLPPLQDGSAHLPAEELANSIADMNRQIALLQARVCSTSALLNYQRPSVRSTGFHQRYCSTSSGDSAMKIVHTISTETAGDSTQDPRGIGFLASVDTGSIDPLLPPVGISSLVRLTLRQARTASISLHDFVAFMRGCSRLEDIPLSFFRPNQPGILDALPPDSLSLLQPVHLPSTLRTLIIEELDVFAARLLCALRIPSTANVTVATLLDPRQMGEVRDADELSLIPIHSCLPPDNSGFSILPRITRLRIKTEYDSCTVVGRAGEHRFCLATLADFPEPGPIAPDPTDTLITVFRSSPLTELRLINLDARQVAVDNWIAALRQFLRLHRLTATMNWWSFPNHSRLTILRALRTPMVDGSMLCPQLAVLDLNSPEPLKDRRAIEEMVRCLRTRKIKGFGIRTVSVGLGETAISDSDDEAGHTRKDFPPMENRQETYRAALRPYADEVLFWDSQWNLDEEHESHSEYGDPDFITLAV